MKNILNKLAKTPIKSILIAKAIADILCLLICYRLFPYLLNYPPQSINTPFQLSVNPTYYFIYYFFIFIIGILIDLLLTNSLLKPIRNLKKDNSKQAILKARKLCYIFSKKLFLMSSCVAPFFVVIGALLLTNTNFILSIKLGFLSVVFLGIPNLFIYVFANSILKVFLIQSFNEEIFKNEKIARTKLWKAFLIQIFFTTLISMVLMFMVVISNMTSEIGNYKYNINKQKLNALLETYEEDNSSLSSLISYINENFKDENWFLKVNDKYFGPAQVSKFMNNYTDFYAKENGGRTYDDYGIDNQGVVVFITQDNVEIIVGLVYPVVPSYLFVSMLSLMIIFLIINALMVYLSSKSFERDLDEINERLNNIVEHKKFNFSLLPITSNDEIGNLTIAFNKIQKMTKQNLETIQDNQNMLMERERLASLGQLIGGIAHNLKTPIMSISGAAEGITDLVKEYEASVGDPEVTVQDHHEIANDMKEWVDKIKSYTEYMSDIITAVKGQAVTMSEEQNVSFTIDELVKRVNILMRHELKNALVELNVSMEIDENTSLKGNINSLVQVVNNMISNAIQAYNGKPDQKIDLILSKDKSNVIITIKDYGSGLPDEVQKKLFKEMITTKGKNGTGLGLFMSYSNIRAHFKGNVTFTTEKDKGTTFNIILPM